MQRRLTALALAGFLATALSAGAEDAACSIKAEEVHTWTATIDGKEYEVRTATPTYEGDTGLFHLSSAYTLAKGKASFSLFRDNLDRDPKDIDFSIHGLSIGYGATDKLEIFGNIGLQNRVDTDAIGQPGFFNDLPFAGTAASSPGWQTGVGDVRLGMKYKFLDDYLGDSVGLALKGVVKLPTADDAKGLGTGKASGAVDLILSKSLNRAADIHASLGYEVTGSHDDVDLGNALRWGVGLNLPTCRIFQIQAELTGKKYSGAGFDQTSPIDFVVGPVFWIKPGIFIRPAMSMNLKFDGRGAGEGFPTKSGRQISVGYHPGTACCEIAAPPPPPPPPPANHPPTVACEVEKSKLQPGETVKCRAQASDPDGDPLSYEWSASAGRVAGSGADATYDSTGVPAGSDATITVRVSDGRGGTAEARCRVSIAAPEKKPEATMLCTSSGFPRNLSRINNVDKACLDDVASRLRQDPRARVVVIGHADSKERHPDVVARTRAEAIKNYLVKERGVDEARVSVRSAGASKPLDTGTSAAARARNRRVEVVFVPEGASAPED